MYPLSEGSADMADTLPWQKWFLDRIGKNEDNPNDSKELSKGWKYTSTNTSDYTTIAGDDNAWCGMSMATALAENGFAYPDEAEAAFSYANYGTACELKPGAILVIRHVSGQHHVTTFFDWKYESKKLARLLGGNQDGQIKIKEFDLRGNDVGTDEIYAVRWPV
jgi:hypothetical protein